MGAIPDPPNTEANVVEGVINKIDGNLLTATKVTLDQNLNDGSAMLPRGNGRFENGTIAIGRGMEAGLTRALKNGANFVETTSALGFAIPYTVRKGDRTVVASGLVREMVGRKFTVTGDLDQAAADDDLNVAGVTMTIRSVDASRQTVMVREQPEIPFVLVDDDMNLAAPPVPKAAMPHPAPDGFLALFNTKYAAAYIEAVVDGGGIMSNNSNQVSFKLNVDVSSSVGLDRMLTVANGLQSDGHRRNHYWIAYILYAYQSSTKPMAPTNRADLDPSSEDPALGATPDFLTLKARGSFVFREETREVEEVTGLPLEQRLVIHEIGHQFGLPDRGVGQGIMGDFVDVPDSAFVFIPEDLAILRGRIMSPGTGPDPK